MLHLLLLNTHEPARIQHPSFLLVLRCRRLPLSRSPHSLGSVLALLALLSACLLDLCSRPIPHQPIMRFELLHDLMAVVYQSEPSRFAPTELRAETEAGYLIFVDLVSVGESLTEFVFGDVGAVGVEDVNYELLSTEEGIADEFARAQRHGLLSVCHVCWTQ